VRRRGARRGSRPKCPRPGGGKLAPLIREARQVRAFAYAPYSGYRVGAALETTDGRIFAGCNVENAAYPVSLCAERVALFKAVSEGARAFRTLVIVSNGRKPYPCGACRQALAEFAEDLRIVVLRADGRGEEHRLVDLLPHAFR